jgi:hypothetical protein
LRFFFAIIPWFDKNSFEACACALLYSAVSRGPRFDRNIISAPILGGWFSCLLIDGRKIDANEMRRKHPGSDVSPTVIFCMMINGSSGLCSS